MTTTNRLLILTSTKGPEYILPQTQDGRRLETIVVVSDVSDVVGVYNLDSFDAGINFVGHMWPIV